MLRSDPITHLNWAEIGSPLGQLLLVSSPTGLCHIAFESLDFAQVLEAEADARNAVVSEAPEQLAPVVQQIEEYFAGERRTFTIALDLPGEGFRQRVQRSLASIPYAETASYGEVAAMLNHPRAARAVGTACAQNPLPLMLPCHRVTAAGGKLGGYWGGLWRKELLLDLERRVAHETNPAGGSGR